ncbi:MAG: fumarate reductase subunit C, partial [Chloroflexota bacterium]
LKSPVSIVLHLVTLAMVVYHTVTWFSATPKAVALWRNEERVGPGPIIAANYIAWVIVSAVIAGLVFAGARG